jgi:hypothetical protein
MSKRGGRRAIANMPMTKMYMLKIASSAVAAITIAACLVLVYIAGLEISIENKTDKPIYNIKVYCAGDIYLVDEIKPNSRKMISPEILKDGTVSVDWSINKEDFRSDLNYYVTTGMTNIIYVKIDRGIDDNPIATVMERSYFEPFEISPVRVHTQKK